MQKEQNTTCPKCGAETGPDDNFCWFCGKKLKKTCNCWIKKDSYNCGEDSCPGYGLFRIEKIKGEAKWSANTNGPK